MPPLGSLERRAGCLAEARWGRDRRRGTRGPQARIPCTPQHSARRQLRPPDTVLCPHRWGISSRPNAAVPSGCLRRALVPLFSSTVPTRPLPASTKRTARSFLMILMPFCARAGPRASRQARHASATCGRQRRKARPAWDACACAVVRELRPHLGELVLVKGGDLWRKEPGEEAVARCHHGHCRHPNPFPLPGRSDTPHLFCYSQTAVLTRRWTADRMPCTNQPPAWCSKQQQLCTASPRAVCEFAVCATPQSKWQPCASPIPSTLERSSRSTVRRKYSAAHLLCRLRPRSRRTPCRCTRRRSRRSAPCGSCTPAPPHAPHITGPPLDGYLAVTLHTSAQLHNHEALPKARSLSTLALQQETRCEGAVCSDHRMCSNRLHTSTNACTVRVHVHSLLQPALA